MQKQTVHSINKRRQELLNRPKYVPPYTEGQLKRWEEIKKNREIPDYKKIEISRSVDKLLYLYPHIQEVYLVGSYAKGDWADEQTDEEIRTLRALIKRKTKFSDIDIMTIPAISGRIENIDLTPTADTPHKIKLYDGGIFFW